MNLSCFLNNFKKTLDYLIISIPFIDFAYSINCELADIRLSYLIYFLYFVFYIKLFLKNVNLRNSIKKFTPYLYVMILITASSLYNIYAGNNTLFLFTKQISIIIFIIFVTWMFFYNNRNDIRYILNLYLQVSFVVSCIALFQEFFYLTGFKYGWDYSSWKIVNQIDYSNIMLRVTAIAGEPSILVYALAPAFYIALNAFLTKDRSICLFKQWQNLIIITAMLLTYSFLGYIGIIISLSLIIFWNSKQIKIKNLYIFIFLFLLMFLLGNKSIILRVNDTFYEMKHSILKNENKNRYIEKSINESTYNIFLHSKISFANLKEHPIFGSGLGSYLKTFKKYANNFNYDKTKRVMHKSDAASLFLRIISELGLFGIFIFFTFIIYNYVWDFSFRNKPNYYVTVSNAVLIFIILRLIRYGVYYSDGYFLFIFIYYNAKKSLTDDKKEIQYIK